MELSISCRPGVSSSLSQEEICLNCEARRKDTVEKLQARILELEYELRKLQTAAGNGEELLKLMWGDNFNNESLH
jgi:hypothetical protein